MGAARLNVLPKQRPTLIPGHFALCPSFFFLLWESVKSLSYAVDQQFSTGVLQEVLKRAIPR